MGDLIGIITAERPEVRNQALDRLCSGLSAQELIEKCRALDKFRRNSDNLYHKVRALFFLYAIHRFHLPLKFEEPSAGRNRPKTLIPFKGYEHLLRRRFEEAIDHFLEAAEATGLNDAVSSALAAAYYRLGFQTLADQVRRSVRQVRGNQWMFRMGHPADQPLRIQPTLLKRAPADNTYPILFERAPVRMDLTHCGWSDIFFLGMDNPDGAKVLNVSIDLAVHGRDKTPHPPVEAYLRVIEEPLLRLVSVDLKASADITHLADVFDFGKDYLGLLKSAVIASGIVPAGIEGSGQSLAELLARLVGRGRGLEVVSSVNNIPKGSRLAVSTTLLAALVSVCMRATGQTSSMTGPLQENERRLVLARALLGEWLGGSGGGWQDSGGVWPGIKLIEGVAAAEGDPEFGVSRGRLLPQHRILDLTEIPQSARRKLQESLVLVHGGLAQNVGPILEMVTEKYLLRSEREWAARQSMQGILNNIISALGTENLKALGKCTSKNFFEPIQTIIPWATNHFTESIIEQVRAEFGADFLGFLMLGGMAGGGMGFFFEPSVKAAAQKTLQQIMSAEKHSLEDALPFAMEPVVYDFNINETGLCAELLEGQTGLMPANYYTLLVPELLRREPHNLTPLRRAELDKFGAACRSKPELRGVVQSLFDVMLPRGKAEFSAGESLEGLLEKNGFDPLQHEQIRSDLKEGRIGIAQNRFPASAIIQDVQPEKWDGKKSTGQARLISAIGPDNALAEIGLQAIREGRACVVTLAAGVGSRWTEGAGVVKALHPFCKFEGVHRNFLEVHLAKSRHTSRSYGALVPHIFTTSYLTHEPIQRCLAEKNGYRYDGPLLLSPGRAVGLRLVPTVRDLRFLWEEMPQQILDEQQQKVRDSSRQALMNWAARCGEASDYTDNLPLQCLHPVGHWFEIPNLFRNGVLAELLRLRPQLQYLLLHNIDTLGACLDPTLLGLHIQSESCLTFEMLLRHLEDRGGGLASVNGRVRLVEGLAMPRESAEFELSYYNSNTCWIELDRLLTAFGLNRQEILENPAGNVPGETKINAAIRNLAAKMPTYITIKEVKKRWGHGQEDLFPVTQFEKLWVDMTGLPEVISNFVVVPRVRGQQLKEPSQLDGWLRDNSAAYVDSLCKWK